MSTPLTILPYVFDIELSGRCNTACSFCPRDEMKRGENFMTDKNLDFTFEKLKRYADLLQGRQVYLPGERQVVRLGSGAQSPVRVILCGMGESLMHRKCSEWVARVRKEIGIRVSIVTNGLLLKEKMVHKLAEADVTVVLVSVPGIDKESYSRYMKIDWERVYAHIIKANEILPGRIQINCTIPDNATFTAEEVVAFWGERNIHIAGINMCHSRGGFLLDPELTGKQGISNSHFCGILARHNFIAWDGRVLSCCHDLHAENNLGHVSEDEFIDVALRKTPLIPQGPHFRICTNCNDGDRAHAQQILCAPREHFPGNVSALKTSLLKVITS